jgi:erythromycin esterase-like protein
MKLLPEHAYKMKSETDLDQVLAPLGDSRVIMIGEASHGTHEYYKIRAEITKRLILDKQLSFVAVEGDWPDVYRINRYVCGMGDIALQEKPWAILSVFLCGCGGTM